MKEYLDGVGVGEGDDIAGTNAGGDELRSGLFDQFIQSRVSEVVLAGGRYGSPGMELSGDVVQ